MSKASVLLVDDEFRIIRSLKILFRSHFEVFTATRGQDALNILEKNKINVIVSDQRMPGMTGVELLSKVKKASPNTMRIVLTGYSDTDAIVSSINDGEVFRFVNKPWDNREFAETVRKASEISEKLFSQKSGLAPMAPSGPQIGPVGVLILDDLLGISLYLRNVIQNEYPVFLAKSLKHSLNLLMNEEIGVILADIHKNNSRNTALIKALKREFPLLVSVVVTDAADANTAIGLINQGQVYRYLTNISQTRLKEVVGSAVQYYSFCKQRPAVLDRHGVESMNNREEVSVVDVLRPRLSGIRRKMLRLLQNRD